jgi:hypothetical protein
VVEFKNGKAVRVSEYLDPKETLEAAGCPSTAAATALDDDQLCAQGDVALLLLARSGSGRAG